jgi:hypothetical protein
VAPFLQPGAVPTNEEMRALEACFQKGILPCTSVPSNGTPVYILHVCVVVGGIMHVHMHACMHVTGDSTLVSQPHQLASHISHPH